MPDPDPAVRLEKRIPRVQKSYTMANFVVFVSFLRLEDGSVMKLERHQRLMLAGHFKGVEETVIILPKKNYKTTTMAALAMFHLWCVPSGECVIGASSRDQATILFGQGGKLVSNSHLESVFSVKGGYRVIRALLNGEVTGGRIRVLAADAKTADGVIPTLAIVDELHRHPNGELYGVFQDGLGPRNGKIITISTAGSTTDSPLGQIRDLAHKMPTFKRVGCYNSAQSPDFDFHEWCLNPDDDPEDLKLVKKANPASRQTIARLRTRKKSPSMTAWRWLRFACGIWTEGEEPWLAPTIWDGLPLAAIIPDGAEVVLGLKVGQRHDTAALVWVQLGEVYGLNQMLLSGLTSGDVPPLKRVEAEVRKLNERFDVRMNTYVSKTFDRSGDGLLEEGLPVESVPQTDERMMNISETLLTVIEGGRLAHDADPALRAQILAGGVKQLEKGWRFTDRGPATDALFALGAAIFVAETQVSPEPMFGWG